MYAWRNMQAVMSLDSLATIGEHDEVLSLFTCHAEILFVPSLFLSTYFNGYSSNLKFLKTLLPYDSNSFETFFRTRRKSFLKLTIFPPNTLLSSSPPKKLLNSKTILFLFNFNSTSRKSLRLSSSLLSKTEDRSSSSLLVF